MRNCLYLGNLICVKKKNKRTETFQKLRKKCKLKKLAKKNVNLHSRAYTDKNFGSIFFILLFTQINGTDTLFLNAQIDVTFIFLYSFWVHVVISVSRCFSYSCRTLFRSTHNRNEYFFTTQL